MINHYTLKVTINSPNVNKLTKVIIRQTSPLNTILHVHAICSQTQCSWFLNVAHRTQLSCKSWLTVGRASGHGSIMRVKIDIRDGERPIGKEFPQSLKIIISNFLNFCPFIASNSNGDHPPCFEIIIGTNNHPDI